MSEPLSPQLRTTIAGLWTGNLFAPFLVSGVAAMLPAIGASLEGGLDPSQEQKEHEMWSVCISL